MKDSIYEQEIEEDALQWPPIDHPVTQQLPFKTTMAEQIMREEEEKIFSPVVELWDGEVVRRDTALTYLSELNDQQVDK